MVRFVRYCVRLWWKVVHTLSGLPRHARDCRFDLLVPVSVIPLQVNWLCVTHLSCWEATKNHEHEYRVSRTRHSRRTFNVSTDDVCHVQLNTARRQTTSCCETRGEILGETHLVFQVCCFFCEVSLTPAAPVETFPSQIPEDSFVLRCNVASKPHKIAPVSPF